MTQQLQTTSWDNSNIYKSFSDPKISRDIELVEGQLQVIRSKMGVFERLIPVLETKTESEIEETIPLARELFRIGLNTNVVLLTMMMYARTATSVNSLNYDAKNLVDKSSKLMTEQEKALKPLQLFLLRAPGAYLDNFLKDESVNEEEFKLRYAKTREDFLLSVNEEVLLAGHSLDGLHAWGKLYADISGSLKVSVGHEKMGLAQASNILMQDDREKREIAYRGINQAWQEQEISAAAILNSINGWRLENNRSRSSKKELHYLDQACHQSRITRKCLNAMIDTTYENRKIGQEALKIMAREMGVCQLGPWDILAPYPSKTKGRDITFPEAMDLICNSFAEFDKDMAAFARMMHQKNWIDATPSENRASGGYCTGFASVRESRIFMTYDGSIQNVMTLAHEIGHAYHSWVMRDMKLGQTVYPMTLAETASIFAETLVRDALFETAKTKEEKKRILWQEVESAGSLLINIPARFEFEKRFMEARSQKTVSVPEVKNIMKESWKYWYEDTLTEYNEMFWASKLHFSMSHVGFYNYPYLFGYLFSLGIYAKRTDFGDQFKSKYVDILRDTGRMTADDLVMKHFNEDITQKNFWKKSLSIVEKSVETFKSL